MAISMVRLHNNTLKNENVVFENARMHSKNIFGVSLPLILLETIQKNDMKINTVIVRVTVKRNQLKERANL